jgi:hypothetical protein
MTVYEKNIAQSSNLKGKHHFAEHVVIGIVVWINKANQLKTTHSTE